MSNGFSFPICPLRIGLLVLFLIVAGTLTVRADRHVKLSGAGWCFIIDSLRCGETMGYQNGLPEGKSDVSVPHTWNVVAGTENYVGKAWYEKRFDVPSDWAGTDVYLKFNAIYRDADIYVNGEKACSHYGAGYTAFYVNITEYVKSGQNILVVSVDNSFSEKAFPYMSSFDWANDGGIIRDVYIFNAEEYDIRYLHVDADIDGSTTLKVRFWSDLKSESEDMDLVVKEFKSGKSVYSGKSVPFVRSGNGEYIYRIEIEDPSLWHFDHPALYVASVCPSGHGGDHTFSARYGYRKVHIEGSSLYLNGEKVRLSGVEWMPGSNPEFGMAEPLQYSVGIMESMKKTNTVITRFHWQQDAAILDWMDENGLLVQMELPWWQMPYSLEGGLESVAEMQIDEMLEMDYNHPCIFAWAVNNEVSRQNKNDSRRILSYARTKDTTRFVNIVNNRIFSLLENDPSLLGDIPTWNEYVGTWVGKDRTELPGHLSEIRKCLRGRPLMITEAGLCEPKFSGGDERRISDMEYHYACWSECDWIAAAIYFSFNDYRTHKGETGTGRYCMRRHGVTDLYNEPKESYYVLSYLQSPLKIVKVESGDVFLECRTGLPEYTVSGYYIISDGVRKDICTLRPGDRTRISFDHVVSDIVIYRPGGYEVCSWKR